MDYSVIIPSCRRPHMLREAFTSVLRQTLPATRVIIIIDEPENRSRYDFLPQEDSRLLVQFTGGGAGAAVARNRGLEHASGEFVFFLDDDDWWYPTKVEKQVQWLVRRPDCVGVTCWREVEERGQVREEIVEERKLNRDIRTINHTGSLSFFGFRRRGLAGAERFDEHLASAQDFEFYIRMAQHGRFCVVPEYLARYRIHDSTRITDNRRQKVLDRRYIYQRHWRDLSHSERSWNLGMIKGLEGSVTPAAMPAILLLASAAVLLAASGRAPLLTPRLVWRFWKQRRRSRRPEPVPAVPPANTSTRKQAVP